MAQGPIFLPDGEVARGLNFQQLLSRAIADMAATGYTSRERIEDWVVLLRNAAERELGSDADIDGILSRSLGAQFRRLIDNGRVVNFVPNVKPFNIEMIRPQLRAELDRRVLAAADLIKLRRKDAVEETLARLIGWSTSIPPGGDGTIDKRETRAAIGKSVAQFKYERRRVEIDQSHKLIANINAIVATDAGAIAGTWHSHGEHDASYHAREDHLERVGKIYLIRDSWAHRDGLVKSVDGYTDEITAPGQEVFCRCWLTYFTSPRQLPDQMLTRKGQEWVERGRLERQRRMAA